MRVSVRRMRAALSVFGNLVDPERTAWLKNELRWLAGSLGPARDWDVFIAELLGDVGGYGIDPDALAEMARAAEVKRADGYATARDAVLSERYTAFMLRMSSFVEAMGWVPGDAGGAQALETSLGANAKSLLNRPLRKLLADGAGLAEKTIAERHPVRIKLKRLRYAVDFLEGLYPAKRVRPFQKAMKRLQNDFGHLNDVAVAVGLVAELVSTGKTVAERRRLEKAAGLVTAWHARGVRDGEQSFLGDWEAFVRAKPFWRGKPAR